MFKQLIKQLSIYKRHLLVLRVLEKNEPAGILRLARLTRLKAHEVRYSLRVLQQSKYILPTTAGAKLSRKGKLFLKNVRPSISKLKKEVDKIK